MIKGHTFDMQTFESNAFAEFVDTFLNKKSGVLRGLDATVNKTQGTVTVSTGLAIINGRIVEVIKDETINISELPNGRYYVGIKIDLDKKNSKTDLQQVSITAEQNNIIDTATGETKYKQGMTYYPLLEVHKSGTSYTNIFKMSKQLSVDGLIKHFEEELAKTTAQSNLVNLDNILTVLQGKDVAFKTDLNNYMKKGEFEVKTGTTEPEPYQLKEGELYLRYFN